MTPISKGPWIKVGLLGVGPSLMREVSYKATGWDTPDPLGEDGPATKGQYVTRKCKTLLWKRPDGSKHFSNVGKSASYHDQLMRWAS